MGDATDTLLGPKAPPRPLKKGGFIQNKGGSKSTERLIGVNDPRINGGKPTLIPSVFVIDGKVKSFSKMSANGEVIPPTAEQSDRAADAALASGLEFPSFPSHEGKGGSTEFAIERSRTGGIANGPLGKKPKNLGEVMGE